MPRDHASLSGAGISPRTVTRRDALRLLIGAGACSALFPALASAAPSTQERLDAAQMSYEQAQAELEALGEEVAEAAGQLSQTQAQVGDLTQQVNQKQSEIEDKQDQIEDKQDQIDQKQSEIEDKQDQIEQRQEQLGERMSSSYKAGPTSTLDLLLSSATFEELTSNIYYLDKVSEADREMIDTVKTLKAELEQDKAELEQDKAELEQQKSELETEKAALEEQKAELEELEAQQAAELEAVRAKQAESEQLVANLSDEVKELMAQRDAELLAAQQAAEEARRQQELAQQQGGSSGGGSSSGGGGSTVITGSGPAAAVVNATYSTPSPGSGLCAAWVSNVFRNAGIGSFYGNADDMYYSWCGYSTSQIQPGMIIAVNTAPYSAAAVIYGHVGIYVGNGTVRHNRSGVVRSDSLSSWISMYSVTATVRCGWLGGIALS
ncbi:CHAP domain-containing protein [Olsenella sp. An293]|uniref:coiled-coil domain-containing protein n=1 Tax=Olsenella sp. An293 TaxID=1965626 RepID=UPI000B399177|nr:CHAP domain-containing protein [Olsenella sp. An293]OUO33947.1 hypothetical protein B5F85_01055 [Olsenella sp. An293]